MFIPYSTERELNHTPYATIGLVGVNVIVFAIQMTMPGVTEALMTNPAAFHWWQPLTSMFAHASIFHIAGNMLFLWVFGCDAEDVLGIPKYLALYFCAGFGAEALQSVTDMAFLGHLQGGLGASGAIMGIVSLFVTRFRNVMVNFYYWYRYAYMWGESGTYQIRALWVALFYVGGDVLFGVLARAGVTDDVAHFAHIGGFLTGLIFAFAWHLTRDEDGESASAEIGRVLASGSPTLAAAEAESQLKKHPDDPRLHSQAAEYLAMKDATRDRAIAHWDQALKLWLAHGKRDEAVDCWRKVVHVFPPQQLDPDVVLHVGAALEHAGQYEQACAAYDAVASHHQDCAAAPAAALRLAGLLAKTGKVDTARSWYTFIPQAWPDSEEALEATAHARQLG